MNFERSVKGEDHSRVKAPARTTRREDAMYLEHHVEEDGAAGDQRGEADSLESMRELQRENSTALQSMLDRRGGIKSLLDYAST